jgi:hypothetical protein
MASSICVSPHCLFTNKSIQFVLLAVFFQNQIDCRSYYASKESVYFKIKFSKIFVIEVDKAKARCVFT